MKVVRITILIFLLGFLAGGYLYNLKLEREREEATKEFRHKIETGYFQNQTKQNLLNKKNNK